EPDRINPAAQEADRTAVLGVLARHHPRVDQRLLHVVHPEPGRVLGPDDELVIARLRSQNRAFPPDGELSGVDLLSGAGIPEVELDRGIDPLEDPLTTPPTTHPVGLVIGPLQPMLVVPLP